MRAAISVSLLQDHGVIKPLFSHDASARQRSFAQYCMRQQSNGASPLPPRFVMCNRFFFLCTCWRCERRLNLKQASIGIGRKPGVGPVWRRQTRTDSADQQQHKPSRD